MHKVSFTVRNLAGLESWVLRYVLVGILDPLEKWDLSVKGFHLQLIRKGRKKKTFLEISAGTLLYFRWNWVYGFKLSAT